MNRSKVLELWKEFCKDHDMEFTGYTDSLIKRLKNNLPLIYHFPIKNQKIGSIDYEGYKTFLFDFVNFIESKLK